jgi:hypothetical protein
VTFRWYGVPQVPVGDDLDGATERFRQAVTNPTRRWSPYSWPMVRAEFRDRLVQAALGILQPVEQVKPVDVRNPPPLYEIRWQGIAVADVDDADSSKLRYSTVLVRLYHSEPSSVPGHFVGHHVHEKDVSGDVNADQDAEIQTAKGFYDQGFNTSWGISELPS